VYEAVVFQAERHVNQSSRRRSHIDAVFLELKGTVAG
jgi:hypothetical protein